jgi:xylulokinase
MPLFLGLDVSTTATKALLVGDDGRVVGEASAPHAAPTAPVPLGSEQDPHDWWRAARASVRQVLRETATRGAAVAGVGLTGQMHGLVLLDTAGAVLRPALLWNDGRAFAECDAIRRAVGGRDRLVALTGNDAFAGFTAPKLLWVRAHEPETFARTAHALLPKDYVRYRLTGEPATDRAGAGGTLLLGLESRDWSAELLAALDLDRALFPPTFEGTAVTGHVTAEAAEATGLRAGTPVVGGGGDQAAQAVGVGAVEPGTWAVTVGTSGVVFAPTAAPTVAPGGRAHAFPHAAPGRWHVMGVMLAAGDSLAWHRDTVAPGVAFDALTAEAAAVPPGADGATFLPYLSGERTPHADVHARGGVVGLRRSHGRGHLTRAVLEGVAFGLKDNARLLAEAGVPTPERVRLSGGAASSTLWRQILADVLDVPLEVPAVGEAAALGAALLAGVGAGAWPSADAAAADAVRVAETAAPRDAAAYAAPYARFRRLYPALQGLWGPPP